MLQKMSGAAVHSAQWSPALIHRQLGAGGIAAAAEEIVLHTLGYCSGRSHLHAPMVEEGQDGKRPKGGGEKLEGMRVQARGRCSELGA